MLVALLHRKLTPAEERMEDLLTAQVLGAAAYLPAAACWAPLIASGARLDGAPLALPGVPADIDAQFWPRWPHGDGRATEPDVVLRWPGALVAVEVKYLSGKSSLADDDEEAVTDQLARQLVLAKGAAAAEGRAAWSVLYLTADATAPRGALEGSLAEVSAKTGLDLRAHLGWTSWNDVCAGFEAWRPDRPGDQRLRADLVRFLRGLGFGRFAGITARPRPFPAWRFGGSRFGWPSLRPPPSWRFTPREER